MTSLAKPLPIITPDNAPFWGGCRKGQFLLQRCTACAAWRYPPAPICPRCAATEAVWTPTARTGRIHSFVIYHRAFHPAYTAEVPYAVALVELDEGIRLPLRVVECPLEALTMEARGEIRFLPLTEEVYLPVFVPSL
ncbi:MAG: OB-fold domain-containing protein [Deltaproteobacteria bacterium]|nr:OB-fold domain-containing protein [Deltaproteobacteria bacterium]